MASCVACHKLNGVGNEFGPDLTKLDPKQQTPVEILHDILEPSFRINEKYQTCIFEMKTGKAITGLILEETPDAVQGDREPAGQGRAGDPQEVRHRTRRTSSKVSIMPKGLLDKLTAEEILDLVAYVTSGGDEHDKLFQGGPHEHHH